MVDKFLEVSEKYLRMDIMEMTLPTRRKVSRPGNASLADNDVRLYRKLHNHDKISVRELAKTYGIPTTTMNSAVVYPYKSYRDIKDIHGVCTSCGLDSTYMRLSGSEPMCGDCY